MPRRSPRSLTVKGLARAVMLSAAAIATFTASGAALAAPDRSAAAAAPNPCYAPTATQSLDTYLVLCLVSNGAQSWTPPPGVSSATFHVGGGSGGTAQEGTNADGLTPIFGGFGVTAVATLPVTPGVPFQIMVGADGDNGGFNGGGGGNAGATGGGASDVRTGACAATLTCGESSRVIVAGGGGGAAAVYTFGEPGGNAGITNGSPGYGHGAVAGGGASQSAGGLGGAGAGHGTAGADGGLGQGGVGGGVAPGGIPGGAGGGGGGGYYGGGGGGGGSQDNCCAAAGGGGSSYGPAETSFHVNGALGDGTVSITYVQQTAPTITSGSSATFEVGKRGKFTIQSAGTPTAALTAGPSLPQGLTFTDNHDGTATLAGTPAVGTGGSYQVGINADNGLPPEANQTFTLSVDQPPAILRPSPMAFTIGKRASYVLNSSGFPYPTFKETGKEPRGLTFIANDHGALVVSGTPCPGTAGTHQLTIIASNHVGRAAKAALTITIKAGRRSPPAGCTRATFKLLKATPERRGVVRLHLSLPGPGEVAVTGLARINGAPFVDWAQDSISIDRPGSTVIAVDPLPQAVAKFDNWLFQQGQLREGHRPRVALTVTLRLTYTPTGRKPITKTVKGIKLNQQGLVSPGFHL
jgi:hypothetical protein